MNKNKNKHTGSAFSTLDPEIAPTWIEAAYVRFHSPVPRFDTDEPISEMKLESKNAKYLVDRIQIGDFWCIIYAAGHVTHIPITNVQYARPKSQ